MTGEYSHIISGRRTEGNFPVTYIVQMARYILSDLKTGEIGKDKESTLPQKLNLENEWELAKYDLEGWEGILKLSSAKREEKYKLIGYRKLEIKIPIKKLEIYPIYILYDTYLMEKALLDGFDVVDFNLTQLLLEPYIARRLNLELEKEYSLSEIKVTLDKETIRGVLNKIESRYIELFGILENVIKAEGWKFPTFDETGTYGEDTGLPEVTKPEDLR